jgi:hypothetical protein
VARSAHGRQCRPRSPGPHGLNERLAAAAQLGNEAVGRGCVVRERRGCRPAMIGKPTSHTSNAGVWLMLGLFVLACRSRSTDLPRESGGRDASSSPSVPLTLASSAPPEPGPVASTLARSDADPPQVVVNGLTCTGRSDCFRALRWPDGCERAWSVTSDASFGLRVYPLDSSRTLVEVQCSLGAYQPSFVYLLVDEKTRAHERPARVLQFPTYVSADNGQLVQQTVSEISGFPDFDQRRHELVVWRKFRGIGDCGLRAIYQFDSLAPRIREARAKTKCDGIVIPQEQWPLIRL